MQVLTLNGEVFERAKDMSSDLRKFVRVVRPDVKYRCPFFFREGVQTDRQYHYLPSAASGLE